MIYEHERATKQVQVEANKQLPLDKLTRIYDAAAKNLSVK